MIARVNIRGTGSGIRRARRGLRVRVGVVMIIAGAAFAAVASPAGAYVYISDVRNNTIDRATLDGLQVDYRFVQGVSDPGQLAVDANYIYWVNRGDGSIGRASIDGTNVQPDFIPNAAAVGTGVAVGGGYIYWTDYQNGYLGRASVNGTGATDQWVTGLDEPGGVAVDSSGVYWTDRAPTGYAGALQEDVGRVPIDGDVSNRTNEFITVPMSETNAPEAITASGGELYWVDGADIARASDAGTNLDVAFGVAGGGSAGVAVDGSHVYWTQNADWTFSSYAIERSNIDGTGVNNPFFTVTGRPAGLAVDGLAPAPAGGGGTGGSGGGGSGGGASGGAGGTSPAAVVCVVPNLRSKSLSSARSALVAAHCGLGSVRRGAKPKRTPPRGKRWTPVVTAESRTVGAHLPAGTRIDLRLSYKATRKSGA